MFCKQTSGHTTLQNSSEVKKNLLQTVPAADSQPKHLNSLENC